MRAPVVSWESASVYRSARHPGPAHNDHRMVKQSGQVKMVRDVSALGFCQDLGNDENTPPVSAVTLHLETSGVAVARVRK
jgi:hypothetical protein